MQGSIFNVKLQGLVDQSVVWTTHTQLAVGSRRPQNQAQPTEDQLLWTPAPISWHLSWLYLHNWPTNRKMGFLPKLLHPAYSSCLLWTLDPLLCCSAPLGVFAAALLTLVLCVCKWKRGDVCSPHLRLLKSTLGTWKSGELPWQNNTTKIINWNS